MLSPWPIRTPAFSGKGTTTWSPPWSQWLSALRDAVNASGPVVGQVNLPATGDTLSAAIVTTAIPIQSVTTGSYRVTYDLRKTVVGASSSLTVTISWTDGGVACSYAFPALTTNTTAAIQTNTMQIHADANTDINYAVAYASTGTPLQYRFTLHVEQMP